MELNAYQREALERFGRWVEALDVARAQSDKMVSALGDAGDDTVMQEAANYPKKAWEAMVGREDVADAHHAGRRDGAGRPIPHACFKIPTGGGKTLVAAAALERLRVKTGLVLWVVPTRKIHEQTRAALRRMDNPVRQRLDRGSGDRVKCMDKEDPFNMDDVKQSLCVMPLTLGAVNRSGKNKDFLLMNQDSGLYQSFFPDSDDAASNAVLLEEHPELERHPDGQVIHSLSNVFRMLRPIVILDEAHRAYGRRGQEYAGMISSLSPRMVVEMSATPNNTISNILVNVSGSDLREEEMIKMPVNLRIQTDPDWKGLLGAAKAHLERLEDDAESLYSATERYIRPIALVRVERTGKDKRDGRFVHSEDARDYLTGKLGVPSDQIAVQTSDQKELDGIKLMSETVPIRWIITQSALMEGWDCSFAYVLVMLDNLKADTSVTQLLGRVLRQPEARLTGTASLDECYVYCHSPDTGAAVASVKGGLEEIGMADMKRMVETSGPAADEVRIRKRPNRDSEALLPLVLHRDGDGWTEIDYGRHVLSEVDFAAVGAPDPSGFSPDPQGWHELSVLADGSRLPGSRFEAHADRTADVADFALPLSETVPNVWQAARISQEFVKKLLRSGKTRADIYNGLPYLVKVLGDYVRQAVDSQAEAVFREKVGRGDIRFDLEIEDRNYRIGTYDVVRGNLLQRDGGGEVQKTLFEPVFEDEFDNDLEMGFAVYLDAKEAVRWWHRVATGGSDAYHLRGWRDVRVHPDFIVMANGAGDRLRLGIYDTKGEHLSGNPDTIYKEDLLKVLEGAFNYGTVTVRGSRMRGEFRLVRENRFEEILAD